MFIGAYKSSIHIQTFVSVPSIFIFLLELLLNSITQTIFHGWLTLPCRFSIEYTKYIFLLSFAIPAGLWIFSCSCLFGCSKMLRIEENGQMRIRCRRKKKSRGWVQKRDSRSEYLSLYEFFFSKIFNANSSIKFLQNRNIHCY